MYSTNKLSSTLGKQNKNETKLMVIGDNKEKNNLKARPIDILG